MKKLILLLFILPTGCQRAADPRPAIAVAESFVFATIETGIGHRRGTPPPRQPPAGGGVVLSAPCLLPTGRHFKTKQRKGFLFRAKRTRAN